MVTDDIELACMDFREPTGRLKNAGAAVEAVANEFIRKYSDPKEKGPLNIHAHEDCGMIKATAAILDGKDLGLSKETMDALERTFVRHFRNHGFEGATKQDGTYDEAKLRQMYVFNRALQNRLAREILDGIGRKDVRVETTLVDVPRGKHADTVVVAIGDSSKSTAEVLQQASTKTGDAYLIRAMTADEVAPSLEVAMKVMGKTDIRIVALNPIAQAQVEVLRQKHFMKGKNHA